EDTLRARFPDQADLPQAGLMANSNVAGGLAPSRAVERAYAESAGGCVPQARARAEKVKRHTPPLPRPAVGNASKSTPLQRRPASEARPQLEALYTLLGKDYPQAIGGRLPDAGFYGP